MTKKELKVLLRLLENHLNIIGEFSDKDFTRKYIKDMEKLENKLIRELMLK